MPAEALRVAYDNVPEPAGDVLLSRQPVVDASMRVIGYRVAYATLEGGDALTSAIVEVEDDLEAAIDALARRGWNDGNWVHNWFQVQGEAMKVKRRLICGWVLLLAVASGGPLAGGSAAKSATGSVLKVGVSEIVGQAACQTPGQLHALRTLKFPF